MTRVVNLPSSGTKMPISARFSMSVIAWFHQLYLFCFRPGSGRVALTGDVRSESAPYCLHQQERADTCQSDIKVLKKNLSAKAVIDHSTKEHA